MADIPARKYNPLDEEDQTELHSFELDKEFGKQTQKYISSIEELHEVQDTIKEIQTFSETNEELREEVLDKVEELKSNLTEESQDQDMESEESEEREYSELTENIYSVFNEFTEELGFISKVQIEQAEEAGQLYWRENNNGDIVAAAIIRHCVNKPQTTLQDIAVLEEYRGEGLAKDILNEAEDDSPHPYMIAKCPQDLPSNHFYRENGWELQRVQDGKNRDLLVWRKELVETESALDW